MDDNCIYCSDGVTEPIQGKLQILDYLKSKEKYMQEPDKQYHSAFAILCQESEGLPHQKGERCIVLKQGEDKNVAIVFLKTNEQNLIEEIHLSTNSEYRFKTVDYEEWASISITHA